LEGKYIEKGSNMNTELKRIDQIVRHLSVTVDKERYDKDFQKATNKFSRQVQIDGFRKGKAPLSAILRLYGDQIKAFYIEEFMNEYFKWGMEEVKANPLSQGSIIDTDFKENGEVVFVFEFETLPEGFEYDYKDLNVQFKPEEYNENMLEETIKSLLEENAEEVPLEKDEYIDEGYKVKVLDTKTETELPDFYVDEETVKEKFGLAVTDITSLCLNSYFEANETRYQIVDAFKKNVPELNDETAKILGHENVEAMKTALKDNITKDLEQRNKVGLNFAIVDAFGERNKEKIKIPQEYLKMVGRRMIMQYMGGQAEHLEKLPEDLLINVAEKQLPNILWDLTYDQIAKDHDISVSEDEINAEIVKYANQFNISADEFKDKYAHNIDNIKEDVLSAKVLDFVRGFCVVTAPPESNHKDTEV
jgi:trigger factor